MRWSSTLSEKRVTGEALSEAADRVAAGLGDAQADLVVAFVSAHHAEAYGEVSTWLRDRFPGASLLGCSAGGVIGGGREIEDRPALSLTAASLPGVDITPLRFRDTGELPPRAVAILALTDPFSCDSESLVEMLDDEVPGALKFGGLASGAGSPGGNALFLDDGTQREGAVGVALSGDLSVDTVVAQGCRPIGQPLIITRCERNLILELGGRSPMTVLRELHESLSAPDRALFRGALHVGVEMSGEQRIEYKAGDFLIRNVVGVDPDSGALAVGTLPERFQVMQFHVRDAAAATADLLACLERRRVARPAGALLFSCLGRGERFFGKPNHDSDLFRERVGPTPLGGFFCNGEIGQVGSRTFLHGYTSSFALFSGPGSRS